MRINALSNAATDFANDDYLAIDGTTNGSRKINNALLLRQTSQKALSGNVVQNFDPTRQNTNPYKAGEKVVYNGIVKTFKVDHYGAWADADAENLQMPEFFAQVVDFTNDNFLNSIIKELHFGNLTKAQVQSIDNVVVFKNYSSLWGIVFKAGNTTISSMVSGTAISTELLSSSLNDGGKAIIDLSFVKDGIHPTIRCTLSEKCLDDKFSQTIKKLLWNENFEDFGSGKYEIYGNNATNPSDLNNLKESGVYIIQRTASTTTLNFPSDFPTDASRTTLEIYNNIFDNTRNLVLQVLSSIVGYDKWWRVYNTQTAVWSGWTKISLPSLPSYVTRCIPSSEYQLYGDKVNNPADLNSLVDNEVRIIQRTADTTTLNFPSDFPTDASRATLEVIKSKFDPSLYTSVQVLTMLTDNYQKWWRVYNHNTAVWSVWTKCNVHTGTFEFKVGTGYQYATIRSAVEAAVLIPNAKVIIYNGIYDLLTEFADKLTDVFGGSVAGVELKNGVHVIAMDGVKITANVPDDGTYTDDQLSKLGEFFNPFYSKFNNSFILENLEIEATNTRYCVHDEHGGVGTYVHKYINCKMKFDNTISRAGIKKYVGCIGGGLGEHGTIVIDGGRYEAHTVNGAAHIGGGDPENHQNCISYHNGNSANCDSSIRITGVYLADRGYIKFGYFGPSTIKSLCEVSGCSLGLPLVIGKEANDDAPVNYDVVSWGNEQKVSGVHWEVGVDGYTQNLIAD